MSMFKKLWKEVIFNSTTERSSKITCLSMLKIFKEKNISCSY